MFEIDEQGYYFLQGVMGQSRAIPWLGEFRVVLDPRFPVRVDDSGLKSAARRARELRAAGVVAPGAVAPVPENEAPPVESDEPRVEVG
jgi:hypothetical protein